MNSHELELVRADGAVGKAPPSPTQVKILLAVLAFALTMVAVEQFWGWPEWLTVNKRR